MRRTSETTAFPGRRICEDESPVTAKPLRTSDSEEWSWMVDEDPAFYLSKPRGVDNAGV